MKIIIEVPDVKAEDASELVRKVKKNNGNPMMAIGLPGIGNPVSDPWFASVVLSVTIRK